MRERVSLFSSRFPGKIISESKLRRVYLRHGVRRKEVKVKKLLPQSTVVNFNEQRDKVLAKLAEAKRNKLPLLFLDEVAFTKTTHMTRTWSPRGIHLQVDQHQVYTGYRSVIATVCCEEGVVLLDSQEKIPT